MRCAIWFLIDRRPKGGSGAVAVSTLALSGHVKLGLCSRRLWSRLLSFSVLQLLRIFLSISIYSMPRLSFLAIALAASLSRSVLAAPVEAPLPLDNMPVLGGSCDIAGTLCVLPAISAFRGSTNLPLRQGLRSR